MRSVREESEALLGARLGDALEKCARGSVAVISYLSPRERIWAERELCSRRESARAGFFGGYAQAERVCLFLLPDYLVELSSRPLSELDGDALRDLIGEELCEAVTSVRVRGSGYRKLSHRDYLGAIMSLGIKRETVGDIFQKEQIAYVFCIDSVSDWIISNIESVASVSVRCRLCSEPPEELAGKTKRLSVNVASERLDAVIAAVWKLSRTESAKLISAQKVAVNSLLEENCARVLKPDDTVSVRGYGKFIHRSITGLSKKGRLFAEIDKLV